MSQTITDCRVYERHSCRVPTSCQPAASNEMRWDATIEELSQSGLRLRLRRRFEPRTALAIEMPGREGQEASTVYVKVVHVHNLGGGHYALGCKFMSELSVEELERLLAFDGPMIAAEEVEPEPQRTVVNNVRLWIGARRGLYARCRAKRLHVAGSWPMAPGTTLQLEGTAHDGSRLKHLFKVVACRADDDGWALRVRPVDSVAVPDWVQRRAR